MKKILLTLIAITALISCGPTNSDSENTETTKFNELVRLYDSISGLYEGPMLTNNGQKIMVTMNIDYILKVDGRTADGKDRLRPVLRISYDQENFVSCSTLSLGASYNDKSGDLNLTGTAPQGEDFSIISSIKGGVIAGRMKSDKWYNGDMQLQRIGKPGLDSDKLIERRWNYLAQFVGKYELILSAPDRSPTPVYVTFTRKTINTSTGTCATLDAKTSAPWIFEGETFDSLVTIQSFGALPILVVSSPTTGNTRPVYFHFDGRIDSLNGKWQGSGTFQKMQGPFTATRL